MTLARISAVLEIAGLFMAGQMLAFLLFLALGIPVQNPLEVLRTDPHADLLALSASLAVLLTAQYGITFLLVALVGRWHRRRPLAAYGFQTTLGFPAQLTTGLFLFAVAELPFKLMTAWDGVASWGPKAFTQEFVFSQDWSDYRFWVFMAVGSFVLIPIVEELFFRGYVQTRLAEDFPPLAAILGTAVFFQLSHGQYLEAPTPWNIGCVVFGLYSALVWGLVFYQTKSVAVTVVAHALVNFPVRGWVDLLLPLVMVAVIVVERKRLGELAHQVRALGNAPKVAAPTLALGLVLAGLALLAALASDLALVVGLAVLPIALVLHGRSRSRGAENEMIGPRRRRSSFWQSRGRARSTAVLESTASTGADRDEAKTARFEP